MQNAHAVCSALGLPVRRSLLEAKGDSPRRVLRPRFARASFCRGWVWIWLAVHKFLFHQGVRLRGRLRERGSQGEVSLPLLEGKAAAAGPLLSSAFWHGLQSCRSRERLVSDAGRDARGGGGEGLFLEGSNWLSELRRRVSVQRGEEAPSSARELRFLKLLKECPFSASGRWTLVAAPSRAAAWVVLQEVMHEELAEDYCRAAPATDSPPHSPVHSSQWANKNNNNPTNNDGSADPSAPAPQGEYVLIAAGFHRSWTPPCALQALSEAKIKDASALCCCNRDGAEKQSSRGEFPVFWCLRRDRAAGRECLRVCPPKENHLRAFLRLVQEALSFLEVQSAARVMP